MNLPPPDIAVAVALLSAHNSIRTLLGLAPLDMNPDLLRMETSHVDVMAIVRLLSHDAAGDGTFASRVAACGYDLGGAAENIAEGQPDVASTMRAWVESPAHLGNILNPAWTDAGFATALDVDGVPYWGAVFARPRVAAPAPVAASGPPLVPPALAGS